jgi:VWFA-related protein
MGATPSAIMRCHRARLPSLLLLVVWAAAAGRAQEPQFRGGTNLVRLDVYVSRQGQAVTDLGRGDFEVLEDNTPQTVTSFEFVPAKGAAPESTRTESRTVAEMRSRLDQPDARAFVLFLDTLHVQVEGSYRAANPVATLLDRVIGEDDLVGVMTPEMTPGNMTFSPRTGPIGDMLRAGWAWGERGTATPTDPREQELAQCYLDAWNTVGIAKAVIERRREQRTVRALTDLVEHLEGTREQRTFVLLLTEGWLTPGRDDRLAANVRGPDGKDMIPAPLPPVGVTAAGTLGTPPAGGAFASCERERQLLAMTDLDQEFRQLTQRANRANVSFYPIDARGLVAFDDPIGPLRPAPPSVDAARLTTRHGAMRVLAAETDGVAVVNMALDQALPRLLNDVGSYYLLGYVSTNQKLDGRYRRLTVRVTRPGLEVRARPGYLAPLQSEVSAGRAPAQTATGTAPPSARVSEALSRLPVGRRAPSLFLQAAGTPGAIALTVELDRTTAAAPEWAKGGVVRLAVTSASRAGVPLASQELPLAAGTRVSQVQLPRTGFFDAGRYSVRVEALAEGAVTPVVLTALVDVPTPGGLLGSALLASRRGPGTGRNYEPTADARMRRTERLRLTTAKLGSGAVVTGRLLNRAGQVMQVPVTITETPGENGGPAQAVGEIALAPLAAGEYVVEITATEGAKTETLSYAVRVVN